MSHCKQRLPIARRQEFRIVSWPAYADAHWILIITVRDGWVAVNGIPLASLDIWNKENSMAVTTKVAEPLQFVEVFSEPQIRLAMLNGNTGDSNPIESAANISLSDNRNLSVSFVERDSDLSIRLGYTDPELEGWECLGTLGIFGDSANSPETA